MSYDQLLELVPPLLDPCRRDLARLPVPLTSKPEYRTIPERK